MTWQKWHKTKYFRFLLSNLNLLRAADYLCFKKGWWKQMKICTKIFWVRKMKMKLTRKASISLTDWRYKIDISMYLTPPLLRSQKAWCYIYFGNVILECYFLPFPPLPSLSVPHPLTSCMIKKEILWYRTSTLWHYPSLIGFDIFFGKEKFVFACVQR